MIKAVVFDFNGVVTPIGPFKEWMLKNLTKDDERIAKYLESAHKWDIGEMDLLGLYKTLSEITGIPEEKIWDVFFETSLLNHCVVSLIKKLKEKYKIILFSNHCGELLWKLLEKHDIVDIFDGTVISSEHKMKKPDPAFFNLLIKYSGIGKDEMFFIDDSWENVEASNKLGIKAVQFKNCGTLENELKKAGIKVN